MAAKKRGGEKDVAPEQKRAQRPSECRTLMRRKLTEEYVEILGAFVNAAKKGSAAHMKLATELLEKKNKRAVGRTGSASKLLRELRERGEI